MKTHVEYKNNDAVNLASTNEVDLSITSNYKLTLAANETITIDNTAGIFYTDQIIFIEVQQNNTGNFDLIFSDANGLSFYGDIEFNTRVVDINKTSMTKTLVALFVFNPTTIWVKTLHSK
jgi:hypothetical protein